MKPREVGTSAARRPMNSMGLRILIGMDYTKSDLGRGGPGVLRNVAIQ